MAHTAAYLNAESFWWWQCNKYVLDTPPPSNSPSLISLNGFCGHKAQCFHFGLHKPVWPSGKALGWQAEGHRFDLLWLSFLLKNCGIWTLFCDFAHTNNETLTVTVHHGCNCTHTCFKKNKNFCHNFVIFSSTSRKFHGFVNEVKVLLCKVLHSLSNK